ncbi:beta-lactamase family protein [Arenibacter sp. F26102]|uniref:serine hydrolase domain-containing protein n=1 Tax=Arenibacter sp. F26102 TaxID=2926416 RepID=UPI001FF6EF01|nr:serine hydrolase [Arenibacter sp. F26102]MCK0144210.1 beta-lactamase family protein [Arenibacter sp. F26102]
MKKNTSAIIIILISIFFNVHLLASQEGSSELLDYANPSTVGIDSLYIHSKVDSIMAFAIAEEAFPGAQVLVAKNNNIIFHKAYGFHTYDSVQAVGLTDIYDLASVTKIMGPLPALMKLHDEGKLNLDAPFSSIWPEWEKRKDKKSITIREVFAHQAGLVPYIIFLQEVMKKNGAIKRRFVRDQPSRRFSTRAYQNIYIKDRFRNKIYRHINRSKVSDVKKYKYSGLTFLLYPEIISRLTNTDYETYLTQNFYAPIGATTLGFNPKTKNYPNNLVPTEIDTLFRHELTKDWVHDENAALLGGVSGNAGLFASATDLAKMMQMYMNYGSYGGKRYLSESTVKEFTKVQYPENENRRGLIFDKPDLNNHELTLADSYPAPSASPDSFGHSGFTGTFVWADPQTQLVYIFLSNRVYPSRTHSNIYKYNIRSAIQQVFYDAIID